MSKIKKNTAIAALCCTFVGGAEGLRQTSYPDPASHGAPWTICYGHTGGVKPGEHDSMDQCKALLLSDLDKEGDGIENCIPSASEMPTERYVALVSLAHNIGVGGVCKSSIARKLNAGDIRGACDAFLLYDRAGGVVFPGLARRRKQERELCLAG